MISSLSSPLMGDQVSYRRLLWVGPLTVLAATLANFVVWQIAVAVLQPDPAFLPFVSPTPLVLTIFGVVGAVIAFALVGRFSKNPIPVFKRVAIIALGVSFIPDIVVLLGRSSEGATLANVLALMLMHVVAYVISVYMLTNFARTSVRE